MAECPYCKKQFNQKPKNKKFCCPEHKDAHHNREKMNGIKLWPENQKEMQSYATEWDTTIENVVNVFIKKSANSDGTNISDADVHGE